MSDNNKDKTTTYRHPDESKTRTYEDSEIQKTEIYDSGQDNTAAYESTHLKEFKSRTHHLGIADIINIRGVEYIITKIVSEGTGEAVIYKITDHNNAVFALKLYFEFSSPKEEPNYETLKRIRDINDPDILKLYDFGVGLDKYQGKYCYEISDFAEGGDLLSVTDFKNKYSADFIEKIVVKEIFNGISKLHDYRIYHCDLKPSNIFFKDENQTDILIGDYGSAKAYDLETEKEIRKTSTVKGTDAYLAPEQARNIISAKNDYYSFGMILLHLLYPEQFVNENNINHVNKEKFEKIVERQYNSQPIIKFNPDYKRMNTLIEGLTLINHFNRFGKTELEKWLNEEDVEVKYRAVENTSVQYLKLSNATIKTDTDFIQVLDTNKRWWEDIFEDIDTYFALKAWIGSYRDITTRKVFDEMVNLYKPYGKEFVKEVAIRFFQPDREVRIDMNSFNFFTSDNIKKDIEAYISKLDEIWKITSTEKLRFYIFQLEFSLLQLKKSISQESEIVVNSLIDKLYSVFGLVQKPIYDSKTETQTKLNLKDEIGTFRLFINLFYTFNPERTFRNLNNESLKTIEDLAIFYIQNQSLFADKYLMIEKEKFLEKLNKKDLITLDYKELIFEIFKDKTISQVDLIELTFDKHRNYSIIYKYYKSLTSFLKQRNISKDFTSSSELNESYEEIKGFFQSSKSVCENFITDVKKQHNISRLTDENLSQIREKFMKDSRKRHFYIYSGQFLALIVLAPLSFFTFEMATHRLHVDEAFGFYWMKPEAFKTVLDQRKKEERMDLADKTASKYISSESLSSINFLEVPPGSNTKKYNTQFSSKSTGTLYFETRFSWGPFKRSSKPIPLRLNFKVFDSYRKIILQGEISEQIAAEYSAFTFYTVLGGPINQSHWKKGQYSLEIISYKTVIGRQYFAIY